MIKENIQTLLSAEMDRKNFLAFIGAIILGMIGVTGLLNLMLKSHQAQISATTRKQFPVQTSGYGGSDYGE
jgi:hypothetical protein